MSKKIVLVGRDRFSSPQVNDRQLVLRNQQTTVDDKVADHLLSQERFDRRGNKTAIWVESDSSAGKAALAKAAEGSTRRGSGDLTIRDIQRAGSKKAVRDTVELEPEAEAYPEQMEKKPKKARKSRAKTKAVEETDNA